MVDIADLQLSPFPEAKARIAKALRSSDSAERYWGAITCSAFGEQAMPFEKELKRMAAEDPDRLVRTRAAEFLGLTGSGDPEPILFDVLAQCDDPIEVNLILNTVVLLRDGAGVEIDMSKVKGAAWTKMEGLVPHRVLYLQGGTGEIPKKKKGKK
jgi:HEAT repeat protein